MKIFRLNNIQKLMIATFCMITLTVSFAQNYTGLRGNDVGNFKVTNTSFRDVYNNYRYASPSNIPWAGSYFAYRRDGIAVETIGWESVTSPSQKYDLFFGISEKENNATTYEKKHHSCKQFEDDFETKRSCEAWWGHCNAWSAAAIKEVEPRTPFFATSPESGEEMEFTVADQKAYLTELWMNSNSLFAGDTHKGVETNDSNRGRRKGTKNWVFDSSDSEGQVLNHSGKTAYQAFWDVTPRAMFRIFTSYVGIKKTGIVIDRFTGDQVWNQPIVGYRLLPITPDQMMESQTDRWGRTIYPVLLRMKMFWAEDGVAENEISNKFDIEDTNDKIKTYSGILASERFTNHYSGRLIEFILYFDSPLVMSDDFTTVLSAGNIVGPGMWYHQTEEGRKRVGNMDETHPDFIWLPTEIIDTHYFGSNGNPYVKNAAVRYIFDNKNENRTVNFGPMIEESQTKDIKFENYMESFTALQNVPPRRWYVKKQFLVKALKTVFTRYNIQISLTVKDITLRRSNAFIKLQFLTKVPESKVLEILSEAGVNAQFIQNN